MMNRISKIWFPTLLICIAAVQSFGIDASRFSRISSTRDSSATVQVADSAALAESIVSETDTSAYKSAISDTSIRDSVAYPLNETLTDTRAAQNDSLAAHADSLAAADTVISLLDTLTIPDSLRYTDTLKFKYYIALKDSTTRENLRDSLITAGDSLELHRFDSLYVKDSAETAYRDSIAWFNSLSKFDKKKYLNELKTAKKVEEINIKLAKKDSIRARKDSITLNTPRILETYALPDSMQYKRLVTWTHERYFNGISTEIPDTSYNYYFYDYPFFRKDVNATYLGVVGSPVQTYDFFKRTEEENVTFYTPYMVYNYSPETLPMYNTKTPYTELAYWGTLFSNTDKEETNVRVMTTQNITPELNLTLEYDRFGANGMLRSEDVDNRTFVAATNYIGKRYLMHAGYIFNKVEKSENGGIIDNYWIRDTTVDSREIEVYLDDADTKIKKNTIFLDQSYRIPFSFLHNLSKEKRQEKKAEKALRDSIMATGDSAAIANYNERLLAKEAEKSQAADSLDNDVTTAFIGHSSEYSAYTKVYTDNISASDTEAREFYNNNFYINPTSSDDSLRVMKLENRIFLRLQPWKSDGIVSKLDVGIGDKLLNYYDFDRTSYVRPTRNVTRNSVYLYAGAQGRLKKYLSWDATGRYTVLGSEINDFGINANLDFNFFPFRRHKDSPLNLNLHFETSLKEPDWYEQHMHTNHYWWDNDFGKISTTKAEAKLNIPAWKLSAGFSYALLNNNIYYDYNGIIAQNNTPMSVMTATVMKNFKVWMFHFDHQALFQLSSNEEVLPMPMLALNFRYYFQFNVVKNVMQMQLGANATWTTKWHAPAYNPALGVFHNQNEELYGNCPYIDVFVNIQWKRACIFIKAINLGMGWPNKSADYFSAHHYIRPPQTFKVGIFWPFYVQPAKNTGMAGRAGNTQGNSLSGGAGQIGGRTR